MKDVDHGGYPSLYRLYMELDDPTEWEVANQLMDGWEHWENLCTCTWFKPIVERWRKEVELRMKSKALLRIRSEAKTASKEAFAANKYILEKGWEPKEGSRNGRGRPTKDDIKRAADDLAKASNQLSDDYLRLGLAN